jgi:hypothetical protein
LRLEPSNKKVDHIDERELADVIYEFGEERRSRRIARAIVSGRVLKRGPVNEPEKLYANRKNKVPLGESPGREDGARFRLSRMGSQTPGPCDLSRLPDAVEPGLLSAMS